MVAVLPSVSKTELKANFKVHVGGVSYSKMLFFQSKAAGP